MRYFGKRGRITSLALAAAMALSAFAGLNAAAADEEAASAEYAPTEKYQQDFETGNDFSYNGTSDSDRFIYNTDDAIDNKLSSDNKIIGVINGENAFKNFDNSYAGKTLINYDIKFDPTEKKSDVGYENHMYLAESIGVSNSGNGSITPNNIILDLSVTATGNGQFNGAVNINDKNFSGACLIGGTNRQSQSKLYTSNDTTRHSTGWMHVNAVLDFSTHKINIKITRPSGEELYSNTELDFSANASKLQGIALTSTGSYGGTYIDNIVIKDAPVVSAIEITGTVNGDASTSTPERVYTNHSATYTAVSYDQYGDIYENNVEIAASGVPNNASFNNNTLTVDSVSGYNEITLSATSGGVTKTKTVAAIADTITISTKKINVAEDTYIYGADRVQGELDQTSGKYRYTWTENTEVQGNNYGSAGELRVNMAENVFDNAVPGIKEATKVALMKFDYGSSVENGDIMNGTVLSATLHYYAKKETEYSAYPYFFHVTDNDWTEGEQNGAASSHGGTTWSCISSAKNKSWQMRYNKDTKTEADFKKPYVQADKQPGVDYQEYSVDVTEFFSADTDGAFVNDGKLSIGCATVTAREIMIASKEYTPDGGVEGGYGAYLDIEYIPPRATVNFNDTTVVETGKTTIADSKVTAYDDYNSKIYELDESNNTNIVLAARDYDYYAVRPGYETTLDKFNVTVEECQNTTADPQKTVSYSHALPTAAPESANSPAAKTKTVSGFLGEKEETLNYVGKRYGDGGKTTISVPEQFLRPDETIVMEFDIFVAKMTSAYFTFGTGVGPEIKFSADASSVTVNYGNNVGNSAGAYEAGQWAHVRIETTTANNTSETGDAGNLRLTGTNAAITPVSGEEITISSIDERNLKPNSGDNKTFREIYISGSGGDTGGGAVIRNSEIYVLAAPRTATAYFVPESDSTSCSGTSLSPVEGKIGGRIKGSTIATAFVSQSYVQGETATTCLAWDVTVPKNGTYVRTSNEENTANAVADTETASVQKDSLGYTIYSASKGFSLKLKYEVPAISGSGAVVCGLVLDDLYAPGATANVAYLTSINDESLSGYDTLTLGAASGSVYTPTNVANADVSETDALSELMSIDSILTMMYTDDELAEITGDIASEDNAAASGIDDGIDMTDAEDTGEAVGDME